MCGTSSPGKILRFTGNDVFHISGSCGKQEENSTASVISSTAHSVWLTGDLWDPLLNLPGHFASPNTSLRPLMGRSLQVSVTLPLLLKEWREKWQLTHCKHNADSLSPSPPASERRVNIYFTVTWRHVSCLTGQRGYWRLMAVIPVTHRDIIHRHNDGEMEEWRSPLTLSHTHWQLTWRRGTLRFTFTRLDLWKWTWPVHRLMKWRLFSSFK